jgi:hypothetical protein
VVLSLDGDVTVKGVKTSPSVDFSEIFDNLDIGLMVEGEIRKGRIGIYANAIYAELGSTDDIGSIEIQADATTVWAGAGAYYRLGPFALDTKRGSPDRNWSSIPMPAPAPPIWTPSSRSGTAGRRSTRTRAGWTRSSASGRSGR